MKRTVKIIMAMIVIAGAVLAIVMVIINRTDMNPSPQQASMTSPADQFMWQYQNGGDGPDGLPQTRIGLNVTYQNAMTVSQFIDQVQGSCNDVDPKAEDSDMVPGTTKVQCYAAGFGQWYKIIRGQDTYEIRRKYFEEGVPDEAPTDYPWETIQQIPLFQ